MPPATFSEMLTAAMRPPTPADRLTLARIALRTAREALRGGDTAAAGLLMDDAMLHLNAGATAVRVEVVKAG